MFNYTDHLGNIRVSYGKDRVTNVLKILEENHYYPFGLKHQNYNVSRLDFTQDATTGVVLVPIPLYPNALYNYKYNGKELQEELGLNMYDYGARNYDPALGRWMNVDPLAETSRRWSPYNYAYNNPIIFVDPDGMEAQEFDGSDWHRDKDGNLVPDSGDQVHVKSVGIDWTYEFNGSEWIGVGGVKTEPIEEVHIYDNSTGFSKKDNGEDWFDFSDEELNDLNNSSNGLGIGSGVKEQLWTAAISQNYKSANTPWEFAKLSSKQQAWRETNTLGKLGSNTLKFTKGLGFASGVVQVGVKGIQIYNKGVENATVRDWTDLTVNTIGVIAPFVLTGPAGWVVGVGALAYSIGTKIYDANNSN